MKASNKKKIGGWMLMGGSSHEASTGIEDTANQIVRNTPRPEYAGRWMPRLGRRRRTWQAAKSPG